MKAPTNGGSGVRAPLGISQFLPCSSVQSGDLLQQPHPVAVLEVEQVVQPPMQVVGQVAQLLPELVYRIAG
jgi:hypothetical protein